MFSTRTYLTLFSMTFISFAAFANHDSGQTAVGAGQGANQNTVIFRDGEAVAQSYSKLIREMKSSSSSGSLGDELVAGRGAEEQVDGPETPQVNPFLQTSVDQDIVDATVWAIQDRDLSRLGQNMNLVHERARLLALAAMEQMRTKGILGKSLDRGRTRPLIKLNETQIESIIRFQIIHAVKNNKMKEVAWAANQASDSIRKSYLKILKLRLDVKTLTPGQVRTFITESIADLRATSPKGPATERLLRITQSDLESFFWPK